MPKFFVWATPAYIVVVEADSEHDAAEAFLQRPVTPIPVRAEQPACYAQAAEGLDAPGIDGEVSSFWINEAASEG